MTDKYYIEWRREKTDDKVWWGEVHYGITEDDVKAGRVSADEWNDSMGLGDFVFTFDKKKIFWLFRDYPEALTSKEKAIFDKENPFWVEFFKGR